MVLIKKTSAWTFNTSSSGGVGIEFFLAEGGSIYLKDPSGADVTFRYGAAGAGIAFGFKLPKVGKLDLKIKGVSVGAGVAPSFLPSTGKVCILDSFKGDELTRDDITGVCMFVQVGGGLIVGGSAYAMLLGMDPVYLAGVAAAAGTMIMPGMGTMLLPYAEQKLLETATSILFMAGMNVSTQAGGGAGAFVGGLF
jgi:hypothetical protein